MEKIDKEKMEQMRAQVLEQITELQANATEFYDSFLNSIIQPLFVPINSVNMIRNLDLPFGGDETLRKIISGYNDQIAAEADKMKLTKEEINAFFEAVKSKATIAMDANEFIVIQHTLKLLPPFFIMVQISNSSKNFLFETLGLLKKSGQL